MTLGLRSSSNYRRTSEGCGGNSSVVNYTVNDHVGHGIRWFKLFSSDGGNLVGELIFASEIFVAAVNAEGVVFHSGAFQLAARSGESAAMARALVSA